MAIAREQRQRDEAWAKVEAARLALVSQAIQFAQEDKLRARTERQQVQLEITRIKQSRAAREWALQYLQLQEKRARDKQQSLTQTLDRWARAQEAAKKKFLQFPERSKGEVRSGRALNFFLDLCGATALNLSMYFDDVDEQTKLLELEIGNALVELKNDPTVPTAVSSRIPVANPPITLLAELCALPDLPEALKQKLVGLNGERQLLEQKSKTLRSIGGRVPITTERLNHVKFTRGQLGTKLTLSLADEPVAVHWPYLLASEQKYQPFLQTIETAREVALGDLRAGKRVGPATAKALAEAVDSLHRAFQEARPALYRLGRGAEFNNSLWRTTEFVTTLRSNVAYLIAAQDINDLTLTKAADVTNAGTLLAYMMEHGLRFAPAEQTGEDSYDFVYRLLIDFYTSLDSLSATLKQEAPEVKADLKRLEAREADLMEQEFQNTADEFAKAIKALGQESLPVDQLRNKSEDAEAALQMLNSALSAATAGAGPPDKQNPKP